MEPELSELVLVNMPNFVGLMVAIGLQWRIINLLIKLIDECCDK